MPSTREWTILFGALAVLASLELVLGLATGDPPGPYAVIAPALALLAIGVWLGGRTSTDESG